MGNGTTKCKNWGSIIGCRILVQLWELRNCPKMNQMLLPQKKKINLNLMNHYINYIIFNNLIKLNAESLQRHRGVP